LVVCEHVIYITVLRPLVHDFLSPSSTVESYLTFPNQSGRSSTKLKATPPPPTTSTPNTTMSHCHDEHDHSHSHGEHDHTDDITPALQNLLYEQIDFSKLVTLNEDASNSGRAICQKTWAQRLDPLPELKSSADEQLLMLIPFTGQVRLHSILLRTSSTAQSPKTLKVFLNHESLDFDTASELSPTQTLEVAQTSEVQEIPVKRAYFNTTRSLALFFEDNWSNGEEEETVLSYLAFKGDFMRLNKESVSVLYEASASLSDHKVVQGIGEGVGRSVQ
jgi:hypothetical protein